ncbi:MAG: hypothetical protein WC791_00550 [Candidatus Paceibacterota bacterium]|jgi:hypothetical protein
MSNATEKPFGIRGTLFPKGTFKDVSNDILHNDMLISIHDEIIEVGFNIEEDRTRAEKIARDYIASWSFRNNTKATSDFCQSWKPDVNGNKVIELNLHEDLGVSDHHIVTTTVTIKGLSYVIKPLGDSYSFENDADILNKKNGDETLSLVLQYYHNEVMGADRPKVGVYRIIEKLMHEVGGEEPLSKMVGESKKYVNEIKQSTQEHRHSLGLANGAKAIISQEECINRTRKLIQAYIDSLI